MTSTLARPPAPGDVVGLEDLGSRNPVSSTRAHHRLDPYWGALWESGSTASWSSLDDARRLTEAGWGRLRAGATRGLDPDAAWALVTDPTSGLPGYLRRLSVLATLGLWRTASTQQVAAITGATGVMFPQSVDVAALFVAGLLEHGTLVSRQRTAGLPRLLRATPQGDMARLRRDLPWRDWVGVTAGVPWRWGSQYDRHNLLATELGVRVAEYTGAAMVFGESLGQLSLLAPPGYPTANAAADLVVVRPDGARVAVEITNAHPAKEKVYRWVQLLTADPTIGLVFVVAERPGLSSAIRATSKHIREALSSTPGAVSAGVAARVAVAQWVDWFPSLHVVSSGFPMLPAMVPTGPAGSGRWNPVDVMDPYDFEVEPPAAAGAVLDNASLLYGVPHWLRPAASPVDVESLLVARAGMERIPAALMARETVRERIDRLTGRAS